MKMKFTQNKAQRKELTEKVKADTLKRMSKVVGGKFVATFGDD